MELVGQGGFQPWRDALVSASKALCRTRTRAIRQGVGFVSLRSVVGWLIWKKVTPFLLRHIDSCQNFMVIFVKQRFYADIRVFETYFYKEQTNNYLFRGTSNNATLQMYGKFFGVFPLINSSVSQGLQLIHSRSFAHNLLHGDHLEMRKRIIWCIYSYIYI